MGAQDPRRLDDLVATVKALRAQVTALQNTALNRISTHTHAGGGGGTGTVTSVAAGDSTITIGGTPTVAPTVKVTPGTFQPLDSDLTAIAGLTATTDNFIQSKSSAWTSRTPTQVAADLVTPLSTSLQPLDTDLTTIGGLSPSNDDFMQRKAGAWANRTPAQVQADLVGNTSTKLAAGNDARIIQGAIGAYPISAYGYVACTVHPDSVNNVATAQATVNTLEVYRIWVPAGTAITGAATFVGTAGTTPGSTNASGFALYTDAGVLITSTPNDYTLFTSTGLRTKAFSAAQAASSTDTWYRLAMVHTCSVVPKFGVSSVNSTTFYNAAVSGTHRRGIFQASTLTYPASFTPSTFGSLDSPMLFMALY